MLTDKGKERRSRQQERERKQLAASYGMDYLPPPRAERTARKPNRPPEDPPPEDPPLEDPPLEDDVEPTPRLWRATDLRPASQPRWLARGRLQRGATNLLVGDEGLGKSLLWVWITAAVSTGKPVPEFGIPARNRGHVLIAAITEDDWCSTVRPRLEVAGADLSMISVICIDDDGSGAPAYPRDLDLIRTAVPKPALVVVDAWLDTVPGSYNVKDPHDARLALHPWRELAVTTDAAVLLLTHTNRQSSASVRERYGITGELRKKARCTLYAQSDDENRLLVGPEKMNNGAPVPASVFTIMPIRHFAPTDDDDGTVPLLVYVGESDRTARQHVTDQFEDEHGEDRQARNIAAEWLREYLDAEGPNADGADAKRAAAKAGISPRTLQRACQDLKVVYGRSGFGRDTKVTWSLSVQLGATGATGANEDITAGHTVTPQSRQERDSGATLAQLPDQQEQGENDQSRQSRQNTHTAGFAPPSGSGRCPECGWHIPTQGHTRECSANPWSKVDEQGE